MLSETLHRCKLGDREITILGTAHISQQSVDEVEEIIQKERPERICVELDNSRYETHHKKSRWESLDLGEILRQGKGFLLLSNMVLSSFQKRLGSGIGNKPGAEMIRAVQLAKENEIPYSLSDRDITITLRRAWAKASLLQRAKMLGALLSSLFEKESLSEEELERLKRGTVLQEMLDELARYLPSVKDVLIDERDRFLAAKIYTCSESRILAVVGAGHAGGIETWLKSFNSGENTPEVESINKVPPRGRVAKLLQWIIPITVVALLVAGFIQAGFNQGIRMLLFWVVSNGGVSALGTVLAGGHPLTILSALVSAPVTSMIPILGVGMVTGLVEYKLRNPKVMDFESLSDDITTPRGFYRNRISRILLIVLFSTLGSAIGTFVAIPYLTTLLS